MRLLSFDTATEFGESARGWLSADEHQNNVILSKLVSVERHPTSVHGWLITDKGEPDLALFWTPPDFLQLSKGKARAARFAADILEIDVAGVGGPVLTADAFAEHWSLRCNRRAVVRTEMTFYSLAEVPSSKPLSGSIRQATLEDFARVAPLATAAAHDMNLPAPEQLPAEVEKRLLWDIGEGRQFMWVEGSSVRALASYADGSGSRGARIRGVYTPPEFRGRGYGTAVTSGLAEILLRGGQSWVGLFADNANLTSTQMYRRLGFTPEFVYRSWTFE